MKYTLHGMIFLSRPKPFIFKLHVALWRRIHLSHYINSQNYRNINAFFVPCAPSRVQSSTNCSCWLGIAIPRMHDMWCCIKKYLSQPVRDFFFFFFLNESTPCESLETCKRDLIFIPHGLVFLSGSKGGEKPCGWSSLAKVHLLHSSCYSKPTVCCVFFFSPRPLSVRPSSPQCIIALHSYLRPPAILPTIFSSSLSLRLSPPSPS